MTMPTIPRKERGERRKHTLPLSRWYFPLQCTLVFFLPTACILLPPFYPPVSFYHYKALQRSKSSLTMSFHDVSALTLAGSQLACVENYHQNLFNCCSQCSVLTKHWNRHSSSKLMPSDETLQQHSYDSDVCCFNSFLLHTINPLFGLFWKDTFARTKKGISKIFLNLVYISK